MDILKEIISTRGVQLAARYTGVGLTWLAGYLGAQVNAGQAESCSLVVATLACAGASLLVDRISHWLQNR